MGSIFNLDSPVMRFLSRMADLLILNLLFIVCCIPVVTIGASLTALYTVTLKMARNEEAYIVKGFLKAFKDNFKISTLIWLIALAVGILLALDYRITPTLPGNTGKFMQVAVMAIGIFYGMTVLYVFPYVARFENTLKNSIKNALFFAILNLPYTVLMLVISVGPVVVTFLNTQTLVYGIFIWVFFGFGVIAFLNSIFFRKVFYKYEPQVDEGE